MGPFLPYLYPNGFVFLRWNVFRVKFIEVRHGYIPLFARAASCLDVSPLVFTV